MKMTTEIGNMILNKVIKEGLDYPEFAAKYKVSELELNIICKDTLDSEKEPGIGSYSYTRPNVLTGEETREIKGSMLELVSLLLEEEVSDVRPDILYGKDLKLIKEALGLTNKDLSKIFKVNIKDIAQTLNSKDYIKLSKYNDIYRLLDKNSITMEELRKG